MRKGEERTMAGESSKMISYKAMFTILVMVVFSLGGAFCSYVINAHDKALEVNRLDHAVFDKDMELLTKNLSDFVTMVAVMVEHNKTMENNNLEVLRDIKERLRALEIR